MLPAPQAQSAAQLSQPSSPAQTPSPHRLTQRPPRQLSPAPQAGEQGGLVGQAGDWAFAVALPPGRVQVIEPVNGVANAGAWRPIKNSWIWPRPLGAGENALLGPIGTRWRSNTSLT